jgi:hypothetical protein
MSSDQDTFVNGIEILDSSVATSSSASLYTLGGISIFSTANASVTAASFLTLGGTFIQGNTIIGGNTQLLSTTLATNTSTGALTIAGGIGITGSAYGNFGNFNFLQAGTSASIPNLVTTNISAGSFSVTTFNPTNITCQNLNVTNTLTAGNSNITNVTCLNLVATSTANVGGITFQYYNGALTGSWIDIPIGTNFASGIGNGGPGVSPWIAYAGSPGFWFSNSALGDICYRNVTGSLLFGNSAGVYTMQILNNTVNISGTLTTANLYSNNASIANLNTVTATIGSLSLTNIISTNISSTNVNLTNITSTNVNLTNISASSAIFRSTTASSSTGSGAVIINGGLGLGGDLNIGGNTSINGNLTVFGSTVTVNSTNVSIVDNIIQLNVNSNGVADSGIQLGRYQIANNVGSGDVVNDTIAFSGSVQIGSTTTSIVFPSGASSSNDFYIGYWIKMTSGLANNNVRQITAYNGTTKTATLATALAFTPSFLSADTFNLYGNVYAINFFDQGTNTFQLAFTNSTTTSIVNVITQANLLVGNLTSNLITTSNLQATNATITNLNLPTLTLTNLTVSNLFATNSSLTNFIGTNQTIANQQVINESVTNETVSNLNTIFATLGNTVNSNITIGTLNVTGTSNLSGGLVQSINQTGTNATITNFINTNATFGTIRVTGNETSNFLQVLTSATIPNLNSTNISASTLAVTTFNPTNITCQNLYSTNTITSQNLLVSNFSTNSLYINSTAAGNIPTIFGYNTNNTTATGLAFSSWNGTTFTEKARFDSVGNFLINTTQPANANTLYFNCLSASGSDGGIFDTQFVINPVIGFSVQGSRKYTFGIDSSDSFKLKFNRGLFNAQVNTMTLDQSGFVGIGTTTPTRLLDVSGGDAQITGNLTVGNSLFTPLATITNLTSTNITTTNLTSTNITTTNLKLNDNSAITIDSSTFGRLAFVKKNLSGPSIAISNIAPMLFQVANTTDASAVLTNTYTTIMSLSTQGNLSVGSVFTSNITSTNIVVTNLTAPSLGVTNFITTNSTFTNLLSTNTTVPNLSSNSITTNNLLVTGSTQNIVYIDSQGSQVNYAQIIFKNTAGTGDLKISGDGGDIQWQGGGGRALQMGAYHELRLLGGRNTATNIPFVNGGNATFNTIIENTNDSIALRVQANGTQTADLTQWTNNTGTVLSRVDALGNLQITSTAEAISTVTGGSITISGGLSVAKSIFSNIINSSIGFVTNFGTTNSTVQNLFVNDLSGPNVPNAKGELYTFATSGASLTPGTYAQTLISNTTANTGLQWVSPLTQTGFYGSEYNYVSVQATTQITSTTGTLKCSLTTGTLVGGTYKIEINYNMALATSITALAEIGVYLNTNSLTGFNVGTTTPNLIHRNIYQPKVTTTIIPFCSTIVQTLGNSINTIGLYYRTQTNGQIINLGNASILLYRIQ